MDSNKKNKIVIFTALVSVFFCCIVFSVISMTSGGTPTMPTEVPNITTTQEQTTIPAEPYVVSTATVGSAGDVLIHKPIYENALQSGGTYNFDHLFTYCSSVIESCDYFVANLETTLGGTDGRTYKGYPRFNSPDAIVSSLKKAGVDCLLTANNHTFDTNGAGVLRTQSVIEKANLDYIGTQKTAEDKTYLVKNVNGISFGFACYTYETKTTEGRKALNGIVVDKETAKIINSFNYEKLDEFYTELKNNMKNMKAEGADVIAVYLHWGNEYQVKHNDTQKKIAQKLCDMGVDVIIGGHPHVVQPVDILTSENGKHKTVCVYSMGNMVSNQRRSYMGLKTGHTEDGLIFKMTFSKYSDGTVTFDKIKCVPTWVHYYSQSGKKVHAIVPLTAKLDDNASSLGLTKTSDGLKNAKQSYERTMALVGEGEKKINTALKK